MLVDLVNAGIDRADLDAVRTERRDEASIRRATAGTFLRRGTGERRQHFACRFAQGAFRRMEWLAAAVPVHVVLQPMRGQHRFAGLFELLLRASSGCSAG